MISLDEFSYIFMKDYLEAGESFTESFVFNFTSSFDGGGEIGGFDPIEIEMTADLEITIVERDFEMTINEETYQKQMGMGWHRRCHSDSMVLRSIFSCRCTNA